MLHDEWMEIERNRKKVQDSLVYEEPEIPQNGMMEFIALCADISYKFIELEHRIEVMSGC